MMESTASAGRGPRCNPGGHGDGKGKGAVHARQHGPCRAGAVGIGEISKGLGLSYRKADGSRLAIDDPALDPVWQAAARLLIPDHVRPPLVEIDEKTGKDMIAKLDKLGFTMPGLKQAMAVAAE